MALRIIRVKQIVTIYRQSLGEFLLIVATAAAIIVLPIEQGVAVGIALSLLHGIWTTTRARLVPFERVPDTTIWWPESPNMPGERNPEIAVVGLQAPLSFLNAQNFRADVLKLREDRDAKAATAGASKPAASLEIDFTAAQILLDLIRECREAGVTVAIARLESTRAREAFERFELYDVLPRRTTSSSASTKPSASSARRRKPDGVPFAAQRRMLLQHVVADRFGLDGAKQRSRGRGVIGLEAELDDLAHGGVTQQIVGNLHGDFHRRLRRALITLDSRT